MLKHQIPLLWLATVMSLGCAGGSVEPEPDVGGTADAGRDVDSAGEDLPGSSDGAMVVQRLGSRGVLLRGTVLTASGVLDGASVLVVDDLIVCVGQDCDQDPQAADATWVDTAGIISAGLIDAHNHLPYNFLPEWVPPQGSVFTNRYQWADDPTYEAHIEPYARHRVAATHFCPAARWGEFRALLHGTTTVQGQSPGQSCIEGGPRNADHQHGLGYDHFRTTIVSPRDIDDDTAQNFIDSFTEANNPTTRLAVHMAEGVSGNNVELEFSSFAGRDTRDNRHAGQSLLFEGTSVLIHAVSLTDEELVEVRDTGSKIVWSPSSNIALYGQTAPVERILELGILLGIGPDWTLSGEDDMLAELRFAREYAIQRGIAELTPQRLWEMATFDNAEVLDLGQHIGRLAPGYQADITVFAPLEADPYLAVISNRAQDVRLVMVGGEVYYGDRQVRDALGRNSGCEDFDSCGTPKFICVKGTEAAGGFQNYEELRTEIFNILEGVGFPADEQYGRGDELLPLVNCQ